MSAQVQFGQLSKLKAMDLKKNPQAQSIQKELQSQATIFEQAQQAYEAAAQNGEGTQATTGAFAQSAMSVDELQAEMDKQQEKLEKLMTQLQPEADKANNQPQGENEDDKNKVKPKQFGSLMA